jgi:hypothetical protein
MIVTAAVMTAGLASAQTVMTTTGNTATTLSANVSEQAQVTVPATVAFAVPNISLAATSSPQTVTLSNIVLSSASKTLRMSVSAPASFTPSVVGSPTYAVDAVSWNASTFTSGTGVAGTLAATDVVLATCVAAVVTCGTTNLVFTLAPNTGILRSGAHTLLMTWKFESMGS